MSKKYVQEK